LKSGVPTLKSVRGGGRIVRNTPMLHATLAETAVVTLPLITNPLMNNPG